MADATVVTQILDRLDAIFQTNAPTGTFVFRDRNDAIARDETPCVNARAKNDPVEPFSGEMDRHELIVDLDFYVRESPATPIVEALHAAMHGAIVTDATLLNLCSSVRHLQASYTPSEADADLLCKTVSYRFIYLIPNTTL